jgi:hypothetical protein
VTSSLLNTHVRDNLLNVHCEYATSLPGSPGDNQMAILVDSTTNPTYHWNLRYNASNSTSYKWEFIGGVPKRSAETDISFANQTSYTASGVSVVAPVAGVYHVILSGSAQRQNGNKSYFSYAINGSGAADAKASISGLTTVAECNTGAVWMVLEETLAASDSVQIYYKASNSGTTHLLDNARIQLLPIRLA